MAILPVKATLFSLNLTIYNFLTCFLLSTPENFKKFQFVIFLKKVSFTGENAILKLIFISFCNFLF